MSQISEVTLEYAPERAFSLKDRAIRAACWAFLSYGLSTVLRLGGSIVLTRLLLPQHYGIMALVGSLWQGIEMLSDIGVVAVIVRDPRTEDPAFINAVWTLAMFRSLILVGIACVIAPVAAHHYGEPLLVWVLPVITVTSLFNTIASPRVSLATRALRLAQPMAIDLAAQALALILTVVWALFWPSVWALVAGLVFSGIIRCLAVYMWLPGPRLSWRWDKETNKAVLRFGRWILLSSTSGYLSRQADRFVVSAVSFSFLGVYSIALTLSDFVGALSSRLGGSILFPALSEVHREEPANAVRVYYSARLRLDLLFMPALGTLAILAPFVVHALYDPRYFAAGWMLQLLAIRAAMVCLCDAGTNLAIVIGEPRYGFFSNVGRLVGMGIGMSLGWCWGGQTGLVCGIALSEALPLVVLWGTLVGRHLLWWHREALAFGLFGCGVLLGLAIRPILSVSLAV